MCDTYTHHIYTHIAHLKLHIFFLVTFRYMTSIQFRNIRIVNASTFWWMYLYTPNFFFLVLFIVLSLVWYLLRMDFFIVLIVTVLHKFWLCLYQTWLSDWDNKRKHKLWLKKTKETIYVAKIRTFHREKTKTIETDNEKDGILFNFFFNLFLMCWRVPMKMTYFWKL